MSSPHGPGRRRPAWCWGRRIWTGPTCRCCRFGITWQPNADARFDLVFPQPKIAHRVYWNGVCDPKFQDWVYVGGELAGGTWAVRRYGTLDEVLNYRDDRVFVGIERKAAETISSKLELGFVFARKIQFDNEGIDFVPSDTLVLRGELAY